MLEPDDVLIPAPKVAFRQIDNQVVVVDTMGNRLVTLNETGSATWMALDGRTVGQVAAHIEQRFDVDYDRALIDVRELLQSLLDRALVTKPDK